MAGRNKVEYPPLPDKQFFTIGEAAALALTKPHIVRYWEREIPALTRVTRRRGGRRYYNTDEVLLLRKISNLINIDGYTITGARDALAGDNKKSSVSADNIKKLRHELERIIAML